MMNHPLSLRLLTIATLLVVGGCDTNKDKSTTIEWTSYGVPHITASNYTDLGAGLGYVLAKDRLCNYAEGFITVNSERAKYLGAGSEQSNIDSDFAYLHLALKQQATMSFDQLDERTQSLMKGFAKGYNHWLVKNPSKHQECRNFADSIDYLDVYMLNLSLNYWPFIEQYFTALANASPAALNVVNEVLNELESWPDNLKGSNGWALGSELTHSGKGMLLSNTHLSHTAKYSWYEVHLTIPGKLNVYGGVLPGFVTPALGFNDNFAWTHTWTASTPGSIYLLTQADTSPFTYQHDDTNKSLNAENFQVEVLLSSGETQTIERTLYRSHHGPIISFNQDGTMLAAKDAASQQSNQPDYWLKLAHSTSVEQAIDLNRQGYRTGSQNIMMTDDTGQTFYADLAAVPNLSDAAWNIINATPELSMHHGVLLDGTSSIFEWSDYVPFNKIPKRSSQEYVQNANEPAWLANLSAPITDYVPLYGDIVRAQSTRTRLSLELLENFKQLGGGVTLTDLEQVMFNHRLFFAELINDDLVALCLANPDVYFAPSNQVINILPTCEVLKSWDKTANLESVGTHLFREYAFNVYESFTQNQCDGAPCWQTPFSEEDPLNTPRGIMAIDTASNMHLQALAYATIVVQQAGIDLTAPVTQIQSLTKGSLKQSVGGGYGDITGSFSVLGVDESEGENYVSYSGLTKDGYALNSGDGFVLLTEFSDSGVNAKSILLYSQSNDKASPHYFDQASLLPEKEYKEVKFTSDAIKADPSYRKERLKLN